MAQLQLNSTMDFSNLANYAVMLAVFTLLCLLALHFVSPEFSPSWRMVSEYALGNYKWILTLFFVSWGLSSICLAASLWSSATSIWGKIGIVLLFISGIGEILAAVFDVSHSLHGLSAMLGVPTLPIAALLITYHFVTKENWSSHSSSMLWSAHSTWFSLALMAVAMIVMMNGFQASGIAFDENSPPPTSVPEGVIALGGYTNRLLIVAYVYWLILMGRIVASV